MGELPGRVKLSAVMDNLSPLLTFARERVRKRGFDTVAADRIELALEEVLVNIINYAYPEGPGSIEMRLSEEGERGLVIEIGDSGISFDPLAAPEADTSASLEKRNIGGLGIFFVRRIMDRVEYHREDGRNILTMAIYPKMGAMGELPPGK